MRRKGESLGAVVIKYKINGVGCWRTARIWPRIRFIDGKTNIHHSRILYDPPPRILEIKAKINKWDLIKIKSFAQQRKLYYYYY